MHSTEKLKIINRMIPIKKRVQWKKKDNNFFWKLTASSRKVERHRCIVELTRQYPSGTQVPLAPVNVVVSKATSLLILIWPQSLRGPSGIITLIYVRPAAVRVIRYKLTVGVTECHPRIRKPNIIYHFGKMSMIVCMCPARRLWFVWVFVCCRLWKS